MNCRRGEERIGLGGKVDGCLKSRESRSRDQRSVGPRVLAFQRRLLPFQSPRSLIIRSNFRTGRFGGPSIDPSPFLHKLDHVLPSLDVGGVRFRMNPRHANERNVLLEVFQVVLLRFRDTRFVEEEVLHVLSSFRANSVGSSWRETIFEKFAKRLILHPGGGDVVGDGEGVERSWAE